MIEILPFCYIIYSTLIILFSVTQNLHNTTINILIYLHAQVVRSPASSLSFS